VGVVQNWAQIPQGSEREIALHLAGFDCLGINDSTIQRLHHCLWMPISSRGPIRTVASLRATENEPYMLRAAAPRTLFFFETGGCGVTGSHALIQKTGTREQGTGNSEQERAVTRMDRGLAAVSRVGRPKISLPHFAHNYALPAQNKNISQ
jgi:hypothetical protein